MTNREIDFEDGVWAYPRPAENSQFVVQPYTTLGNRNQFTLPDLSLNTNLTRILSWQPDRIHFMIVRGLHEFDDYSAADVVADWTYVQDPSQGHYVPDPGQARMRFNLWLRDGSAPIGDGGLEVVVDRFTYNMPGDANLDGLVDQADYTVWYNHYGAAGGWTEGDFTGDGVVDQADYTVWYNNYGSTGGSVPEPVGLTALVLGGLTILRRRK
jgi:hypothetical protein